jgi:hypothetical protein
VKFLKNPVCCRLSSTRSTIRNLAGQDRTHRQPAAGSAHAAFPRRFYLEKNAQEHCHGDHGR